MNTAINQNTQPSKVQLSIVENSPQKTGQQCLADIRAMLNNKRRNPAYIYNSVLNEKQRLSLCFAAGLSRSDSNTAFNELPENARIALKNALLMFNNIFNAFKNNNALEQSKFIKVDV